MFNKLLHNLHLLLQPSDENEFSGYIPVKKLQISYCKSSGPGGQHVNTTNTKVTVSLHLESADWIPENAKQKLAVIVWNNFII